MLESQYKMNLIKIGLKIAYYRKLRGFTQEQLAEKIGYTEKSVSKWENGSGLPTLEMIAKLADLNLRTYQDYEQGAKPINRIALEDGLRLAEVLKTDIKRIME